jgi:acetyl esterase
MRSNARVTRRVGPWLGRLPPRAQVRLSGRPPVEIDGQRLDPEVQLLLALRERLEPPHPGGRAGRRLPADLAGRG